MEPKIVKIKSNQFNGIDTPQRDIPEGLCQFDRPLMTDLINERWVYYKNNGLMNFAFAFKRSGLVIFIGADYVTGIGFLQEDRRSYMLTNILGEDMFRASKEEIMEIFIAKGHHMSDWLLFNQDLWNPST